MHEPRCVMLDLGVFLLGLGGESPALRGDRKEVEGSYAIDAGF